MTAETSQPANARVAAVVIGRNEGARLTACLESLDGETARVVYVDSGSTDGSIERARQAGAEVVALDPARPFTAARARNAGLAALGADAPAFVQLIDGDCVLQPGWIATGMATLDARPDVAVVCGRRREAHPEVSVYNRLCDIEWRGPAGEVRACGGDALARVAALRAVDGFDEALIAGEEPDLCVRLRANGWRIHRLDAEMTLHDAAMTRFAQWWQRNRRAGHAFAEGAARHGAPPERHWVREARRALAWGAGLPVAIALAALIQPWALTAVALYPLQVVRLAVREGPARRAAWEWAAFTVLGKFAEAAGALGYHAGRLRGRRKGLIEYR
ncbi:glycosyltransferase family 2 protein [Roseovarius salinarum]|uniref:glycosyltransferase family 2 protein n=1 Tax=Roseovarius salinarum TaxID=1981892 RepID=UPI000C31EF47|nr:glycosyltransferase [Roseovarius salinarum]